MLRFLLKLMILAWLSFVLILLVPLNLGRTAPEISKLAFFVQKFDGSDYWRLDMFTGVSFKDNYSSRIFIPEINQSPILHFLAVTSDANYSYVSEVNLYNQEERYLMRYPARAHRLVLAGDFVFTADDSGQWRRIHIPDGRVTGFRRRPNIDNINVSPDRNWIAGHTSSNNLVFIHVLDGRSYEIPAACCVQWSPDSQWFLVSSINAPTITVFRSEDGALHPSFPPDMPAQSARWSDDGQAIFYYESGGFLHSIDLSTNEILEYPNEAEAYQLDCLSPNQRYLLGWKFESQEYNTTLALEDLETGERLWRLPRRSFSGLPQCVWSEDSRYLAFYVAASRRGQRSEAFFLIDTWNQGRWRLFPENMLESPVYLHIPD